MEEILETKEQETLQIDRIWKEQFQPFHFFGPCSAESPEQLRSTAKDLADQFDHLIFRAGVWKPRTRPSSFEGAGNIALEWLKEIKQEFNISIGTEVANAQHVEDCLKAEIDVLWLGARTTVNPFSVQAIADALNGADVQVFVKNPIHPDLSLWMGALERVNMAGIRKLGAIHRGFHLSDNGPYRNYPNWHMAIQLKAAYPELPIICDASHISGNPDLITQVAQKALDLDMDGLMIETHHQPEEALSDKEQQITPDRLLRLMKEDLVFKRKSSSNKEFKNQLELLRDEIDKIDDDLIDRIAVRMSIAEQMGVYKRENNVTILQLERWKSIMNRVLKNGKAMGLSDQFITGVFNAIHDESIRKQTGDPE